MEMCSQTIETRIERLAAGGDGVGRAPDGRVLFVPLTAPGDLVRVRITKAAKRFVRGEIEEILEASQDRVEPRCAVFGTCGGCTWQHLAYPQQLVAKQKILHDALVRIGHLDAPESLTVAPSPAPYGYRSRTRFQRDRAAHRAGYRMRSSHQICAVTRCPVLEPALENALSKLAGSKRGAPGAELAAGSESAGSRGSKGEEWEEWEMCAGSDGKVLLGRCVSAGTDRQAAGSVLLRVGNDELRVSQGVFAQANALLLGDLVRAVVEEVGSGTTLVELFAGAGLFTLALARRFDVVWAIESSARATADLEFNLARSGAANAKIRTGPVEEVLPKLEIHAPDALLLDPPRTGLPKEALAPLLALAPERLVYLSCDPATLARDLRQLTLTDYDLRGVKAFDLFPQTPHLEVLATLTRRGPRRPAPRTTGTAS